MRKRNLFVLVLALLLNINLFAQSKDYKALKVGESTVRVVQAKIISARYGEAEPPFFMVNIVSPIKKQKIAIGAGPSESGERDIYKQKEILDYYNIDSGKCNGGVSEKHKNMVYKITFKETRESSTYYFRDLIKIEKIK